ncbi:chemotaxis response regulator protein-glutamate methylesterase [candidate division WOR-3 bacterium]|jgi:two-component system chemotaxis response regulator CheB|nr:chemotaxis response regulator protein-glutamate methylesterase [candidate division WOR-3 bacterium]
MNKIRVLVVDDSVFMRKFISDMLNNEPDIEVVAKAKNGKEALHILRKMPIDVITMDIEMPVMDGITATQKIMKQNPIPIIILSAYAEEGAGPTIKALQEGAIDFIRKPSGPVSFDIDKIKSILIEKIRNSSNININLQKHIKAKIEIYNYDDLHSINLVIGASTGGPKALTMILKEFPYRFPISILIVQHMPEGFTKQFAQHLDKECNLSVREATDGMLIKKGNAIIAKAGYHMMVESIDNKTNIIRLIKGEKINSVMPSCEPLFNSAAKIYKSNLIGIVLTGMGKDGSCGMKTIKKYNGFTIAESALTAMINGMPQAAIKTGAVDYIKPLNEIPETIVNIMKTLKNKEVESNGHLY